MNRSPISQLDACTFDVLVVGGGATGLGVAVQAALEGYRVLLVEARDFASGTSSRSTKLLHGGVRYLAQGRVGLVREALHERAVVMRTAPHLAQPLAFRVAERRRWALPGTAIGLKFYQWLAGGLSLGATEWVSGTEGRAGGPGAGVRYWDGQFEDARLALALARTAEAAGARVRNHTEVQALSPGAGGWRIELTDAIDGHRAMVQARCVVNATGVWVDRLRRVALAPQSEPAPLVQPSQGVHLVVSRATLPLDEAVLVPHTDDGRVLFAVPWLGATVIGTTDTPRIDAPREPRPMPEELDFLFGQTRRSLGVDLQPADVRSVWVGLRPLVGAGGQGATSQMSREHTILREAPGFLTVTGGKWTTYRSMADEVMQRLRSGGDLGPAPVAGVNTAKHPLHGAPSGTEVRHSLRDAPGAHLFGTDQTALRTLPGADRALGLGLTEAMVRYSARHEWAITVEDMLARRWRALFLDARRAEAMAPVVGNLLREETGIDPQLQVFLDLCRHYRLDAGEEPVAPVPSETQPSDSLETAL